MPAGERRGRVEQQQTEQLVGEDELPLGAVELTPVKGPEVAVGKERSIPCPPQTIRFERK
ncbi:MAG: hypothetical protein OHK0015_26420 [Chloroflexi bacterium OHK40]